MTPELPSSVALDVSTAATAIDSLLHPQAALIRSLLQPQPLGTTRPSILIDDEENIAQALAAGIAIRSIFLSDDAALSDRLRRQLPTTAHHYTVARRTCKKLFGNERLSRIFAIAEAPAAHTLDELSCTGRDFVVLDGIGISGNIGAIIRTSAAMAVGGVALVNTQSVDLFDRRLIRASRGHVFSLPVVVTTTDELLDFCTTRDWPLVVTTPIAHEPLDEASSSRPIVIVFGAEKSGCSPRLAAAATRRIAIPTSAAVQSLNVAAAAAIALYGRYPFNSARLRRNECVAYADPPHQTHERTSSS
jgi:23S rRNA (adenosine1067-2'-O)-methyltransferase